jgi:hypothetical protein
VTYLIDANIMIEAKNRYYGFDICPGFWDWLEASHGRSQIFSITSVRDEILKGRDDLAAWVRALPIGFFLSSGPSTVPHLTTLAQWANDSSRYLPTAKATFLSSADYYLVAQAREVGAVVVTHELPSESQKRIKIPEAAAHLGVRVMSPFEVMRVEGAVLAL